MPRSVSLRRWLLALAKLLLIAAVVWGVWQTLRDGWHELTTGGWSVDWLWFAAAGLLYAAALLPMAWYWHRALLALGQQPSFAKTVEAYFIGHLGKYVPGKVLVLVLRSSLLAREGTSIRAAVLAVFIETLTIMAVGALVAVALAPFVLVRHEGTTIAAAGVLLILVGLPTVPPVARQLAYLSLRIRRINSDNEIDRTELPIENIRLPLLVRGWAASLVSWLLMGLSLWAIVCSTGAEMTTLGFDVMVAVAVTALTSVAGFASMLPGGIGVRDVLIVGLLAPYYGDAPALLAAGLLRLNWIVSELVVCGILYSSGKLTRNVKPNAG